MTPTTPPVSGGILKAQFDQVLDIIAPVAPGGIAIPKAIRDQMERFYMIGSRVMFLSIMLDLTKDTAAGEAHLVTIERELVNYFKGLDQEVTVEMAIQAARQSMERDVGLS